MSTRIFKYLLMFAFTAGSMGMSTAQSPVPQARFAIEFPGFNGAFPLYVTLPEAAAANSSSCSSYSYDHSLSRLANAPASVEQPEGLRLKICVEGGTVLITPTVFYGAFDRQNPPVSLEKLRHQTLTTHSGRLNDTVTFPEMEQVGLEPLTLRLVTAQSDHPWDPLTHSDAPSVLIDYAPVDRTYGMATLRNLSDKAIEAFRIGIFQGPDSEAEESAMEELRGGFSELIAPSASYQKRIAIQHSGKMVGRMFIENPQPQYLVLQSVLFADGSYEGNAQFAANMAARDFGAHLQLVRIEHLAEPILAEEGIGDEVKIERIRSAVRQLSVQADPEIIAQFHSRFPNFSADVLTHAEGNIGLGMRNESESMDNLIQENEPILQQDRSRLTLAQLWTSMTGVH